MWCRASSQNLLSPAAALRLASGAGNGPGDFVQEGDNVDRQAAAFLRAAGLPFEEIETPFAAAVDDDKVVGSATIGSPFLPLAALLFFGAKHQPAEIGGKVAVGKVLGGAAGFATAGCAKDADSRLRVGQPKGLAVAPIPQHRLRVEIRQFCVVLAHGRDAARCVPRPQS